MFNCARVLSNIKNLTVFLRSNEENSVKIICSNIVLPSREKHGIRKIKVHDNYWVPRKRAVTDDKLTEENKAFLQDIIKERFLKPGESPLRENHQVERPQWTPESVRVGVIVRKIGAYPMWKKTGEKVYTTLLQVVDNHVIRYNPPEIFSQSKYYSSTSNRNKLYGSLVVGAENADPQLFTAAYNGLFAEAGVMPKKKLTRFRITPDAKLEPGTPLFANHFRVGDYVNVRGITRYQGFQGVMKRYGFKGGPATHGVTKSHRRPGCIGGGRKRGVWKGKKMPGLMGGRYRLHVGLKIWRINTKHNVIYVHGSGVPGGINSYCTVYDSYVVKKHHTEENPPPFPTFFPEDITEPLPENTFDKDLHTFSEPSVIIEEESTKATS